MKVLLTLLILALLIPSVLAQSEEISIVSRSNGLDLNFVFNQEPYSINRSNNKTVIEYFNALNEGIPGTPALPSKTYFIAIPPNGKTQVQLTGQKHNFLSNAEIKLNPTVFLSDSSVAYKESNPDLTIFISDQYPSNDVEIMGYSWIRDYYCVVIKVNTHIYNWKKKEIHELLSCNLKIDFTGVTAFNLNQTPLGEFDKKLQDVILNYNSATQFRSFRPFSSLQDSTGNWIDYSQEYVKLQIPEDGIYRIDYNQVLGFGINPQSIDPKKLKMFYKGNELPIFVSGEADLSFDPGDYLEFWAEKNYGDGDYKEVVSLGQDYINYLDRYSDTSIVWLSWNGNDGKRIAVQNSTIPGIIDTISSHTDFKHLEEDERLWYYDAVSPRVQLPFWQENKVWTWQVIGAGGIIPINFSSTDFVPNTPVNASVRLISSAANQISANAHKFGLSLNVTSSQDTIVFNYKQTVNFSATFNSNQLINGNSIVRVFGLQNDSLKWHQALIDWVDIQYERYNVASNDSLKLRISDNIQSALRVIKVDNISQPISSILVYKTSPFVKKITSLNLANSVLTFTDTVSVGDEYFITKESS
ncbi:MAG: hypothetical protein WBN42_06855, partial [Ignavibacteriaceae bacterium]